MAFIIGLNFSQQAHAESYEDLESASAYDARVAVSDSRTSQASATGKESNTAFERAIRADSVTGSIVKDYSAESVQEFVGVDISSNSPMAAAMVGPAGGGEVIPIEG